VIWQSLDFKLEESTMTIGLIYDLI